MGTGYDLTVVRRPRAMQPDDLHAAAKGELERIEALMSAYRGASDVGRINAAEHDDWVAVSAETAGLIERAVRIGRLTGGAYDITAGTLVNLWGFGPGGRPGEIPTDERIEEARRHVGLDRLEVRAEPPAVRKRDPWVRIDLASIAKGYGVDCAAAALERAGVEDYCVAVGGEVRVRGFNPRGVRWQIAIDSPEPGVQATHRVVALTDQAIATSGDYRIFVEQDGARLAHVIDPRTGRPVGNAAASVTVLHASCATADAWATAVMAMGSEAGFELAVREGLAALLLVGAGGRVEERATPGFGTEGSAAAAL